MSALWPDPKPLTWRWFWEFVVPREGLWIAYGHSKWPSHSYRMFQHFEE